MRTQRIWTSHSSIVNCHCKQHHPEETCNQSHLGTVLLGNHSLTPNLVRADTLLANGCERFLTPSSHPLNLSNADLAPTFGPILSNHSYYTLDGLAYVRIALSEPKGFLYRVSV